MGGEYTAMADDVMRTLKELSDATGLTVEEVGDQIMDRYLSGEFRGKEGQPIYIEPKKPVSSPSPSPAP